MERANSLMGRFCLFVCQQSGLRVLEILRVAYLCITQCMDEDGRCAEFVMELLDLRDGLLHLDILGQNELFRIDSNCLYFVILISSHFRNSRIYINICECDIYFLLLLPSVFLIYKCIL